MTVARKEIIFSLNFLLFVLRNETATVTATEAVESDETFVEKGVRVCVRACVCVSVIQ